MPNQRTYTADFYCVEQHNKSTTSILVDLLKKHVGGHAPAYSLDGDQDIKYQIRSIAVSKTGTVYRAVFGKLRHDGTPEQAAENSEESDVELKPGHGLVEKSHFLFFPDLNLIVFQRNQNAGRSSHFQAYLNKPAYQSVALVPVLSRDSYAKLANGGEVKKLEISLRRPAFALQEEDALLKDCIDVFQNSGAGRMKLVLSAELGKSLKDDVKNAAIMLSKFSRTKVARATMVEDNDIVDLIVDRVVRQFKVDLLPNGRPDPKSIFAGLAKAKDDSGQDLQAFFNP